MPCLENESSGPDDHSGTDATECLQDPYPYLTSFLAQVPGLEDLSGSGLT